MLVLLFCLYLKKQVKGEAETRESWQIQEGETIEVDHEQTMVGQDWEEAQEENQGRQESAGREEATKRRARRQGLARDWEWLQNAQEVQAKQGKLKCIVKSTFL